VSCRLCEKLHQESRMFRSHPQFVVVSLEDNEGRTVPVVVSRNHDGEVPRGVVAEALGALKEVAVRAFGSGFFINTWNPLAPDHWSAFAVPLRPRYSAEKPELLETVQCKECGCVFSLRRCRVQSEGTNVQLTCPNGCELTRLDLSTVVSPSGAVS